MATTGLRGQLSPWDKEPHPELPRPGVPSGGDGCLPPTREVGVGRGRASGARNPARGEVRESAERVPAGEGPPARVGPAQNPQDAARVQGDAEGRGAGKPPGQGPPPPSYSVMRLASSVQAAVELAEKTR